MRIALSIAGSDPTGGAGLQLDLQVFRAFGVHGAGVVSALTVQDTAKVHQVLPVFPSVVLDQLRMLVRDVTPHAVKLGMLGSDDVVLSVALGLDELRRRSPGTPLVIDPVLVASDGTALLQRRAWSTLTNLFPHAALVTPNLDEAAALSGCDTSSEQGIEAAARVLTLELGARAALVKGGHRNGPPDDCLLERKEASVSLTWLRSERLPGSPIHGTGCALSAAIAARLALGTALPEAVTSARGFVQEAIRRAEAVGRGARLLAWASSP